MIESAHCTCMAGLGEVCSHVAAILFFLESESRAPRSCTQELCKWNEPCVLNHSICKGLQFTLYFIKATDELFKEKRYTFVS